MKGWITALRAPLQRYQRRLSSMLAGGSLILVYHRVADLETDPWSLAVHPDHFRQHLAVLRRYSAPVPLQHLAQSASRSTLPRRAVAVTFDDGYADNLYAAKPALEHFEVPATVFVTTGEMMPAQEFWWDELDRLLLQPGTLPRRLSIAIGGTSFDWDLGSATQYTPTVEQHASGWSAGQPPPTARHVLFMELWQRVQRLSSEERHAVLDDLRSWAHVELHVRSTYRRLTNDEIMDLVRGDLVDLGAHTVTHTRLSTLPLAAQRDEIEASKQQLEAVAKRRVNSFAYPFGRPGDFTPQTVALVRAAGFTCACVNFSGPVKRATDPFQLPRFYVRDCDGEQFAHWLFSIMGS